MPSQPPQEDNSARLPHDIGDYGFGANHGFVPFKRSQNDVFTADSPISKIRAVSLRVKVLHVSQDEDFAMDLRQFQPRLSR